MYTPNNVCVFNKAITGCQAGLIASRAMPFDPYEADYVDPAERADAFAQAVDTAWGAASYTNADLDQIFAASQAIWANGRSPVTGAAGLTAAGYTSLAVGIVAATQAGTAQIVAEGIDPNGCGGGGSSSGTNATRNTASGVIGAAQSITFDAPAYTPLTTGFALIMIAYNGTVSNAGDGVIIQPRINAASANNASNANSSGGDEAAGVAYGLQAITAGVAFTPGVVVTNNTGGHTVAAGASGIQVTVIELQTH